MNKITKEELLSKLNAAGIADKDLSAVSGGTEDKGQFDWDCVKECMTQITGSDIETCLDKCAIIP